jgi:hypothetical protein
MAPSKSSDRSKYVLTEACFSLVICGTDHQHWVGYAFVDRHFDEDEDLDESLFPYKGCHEDPIVSDCGEDILDANLPIWDPRRYFLVILKFRIANVLKEWTGTALILGTSIDSYEVLHPPLLLNRDH